MVDMRAELPIQAPSLLFHIRDIRRSLEGTDDYLKVFTVSTKKGALKGHLLYLKMDKTLIQYYMTTSRKLYLYRICTVRDMFISRYHYTNPDVSAIIHRIDVKIDMYEI